MLRIGLVILLTIVLPALAQDSYIDLNFDDDIGILKQRSYREYNRSKFRLARDLREIGRDEAAMEHDQALLDKCLVLKNEQTQLACFDAVREMSIARQLQLTRLQASQVKAVNRCGGS